MKRRKVWHLFSDRRSLVDRRTELKNTVHSILHRNLITYEFSDLFKYRGWTWLRSLIRLEASPEDQVDPVNILPLSEQLRLRALVEELVRLDELIGLADASITTFSGSSISETPA